MLDRNILDRVTPPPACKPDLRALDVDQVRRLLEAGETTKYASSTETCTLAACPGDDTYSLNLCAWLGQNAPIPTPRK